MIENLDEMELRRSNDITIEEVKLYYCLLILVLASR
jgi:hypothetical protein